MLELKIVITLVAVVYLNKVILRIAPSRTLLIMGVGMPLGYVAQLLLGRELNRYNGNVSLNLGYVSLGLVVIWGIGLASIYCLHLWSARRLRIKPNLLLQTIFAVLLIVVIEFIGSHLLQMKLFDHTRYRAIIPALNIMHAPLWLYGYYWIVNTVFYYALKAAGIERKILPLK